MPEIRQAEDIARGPNWPWRRSMGGASAILALVICASIAKSTWDAFAAPPSAGYAFYDPPPLPSLVGYVVFALLLSGSIAALWQGKIGILALGWLAMLAGFLIDAWLMPRTHPGFFSTRVAAFSGVLRDRFFLVAIVGFGLALAGRFPQIRPQ